MTQNNYTSHSLCEYYFYSFFVLILRFLFYVYECFALCMSVYCMYAWCLWGSSDGVRCPATGIRDSCELWVQGIELKTSERGVSALNLGAISLTPNWGLFKEPTIKHLKSHYQV